MANGEQIIKRVSQMVGWLGAGTALFFILGFTIVETYIFSIKLEGIFWFSNEFYARAGGRFLLDIVQSLLFTVYIVLPYFWLLLRLLPSAHLMERCVRGDSKALRNYRIRVTALLATTLLSFILMVNYDRLWATPQAGQDISENQDTLEANPSVGTAQDTAPQWETSQATRSFLHTVKQIDYFAVLTENLKKFIYIDLFLPVAILLGLFLYKSRPTAWTFPKRRIAFRGMALVFVIYVCIFVISYARFVYDWQVVRLFGVAPGELGTSRQMPDRQPQTPEPADTGQETDLQRSWGRGYKAYPYRGVYLIAAVGGNYLFLEKHQGYEVGRILSADKKEFPLMRFDLRKTTPLRQLINQRRSKAGLAYRTTIEYLKEKEKERPQGTEEEYEKLPSAGGWVEPGGGMR